MPKRNKKLMPAILPNYEYDIFISYRQNDNKKDGWVTNFVAALKDELEATLKNPVSIYFDENPHDGLLETHQVNASLEKKLKCIVFIPIISQTYCDTSSFAWEHEFLPFLKMVREDELGMNITLANGNVASRVLPVKIHDLDAEDQTILEKELEGPLRSIDFIHRAAGVNRPLTSKDDQVRESGKVLYSDQINKVANALKEIGTSVARNNNDNVDSPVTRHNDPDPRADTSRKSNAPLRMIIGSILIPVLFALAYYGYKAFNNKPASPEKIEKSIAIMPFTDMSPNKDQEWFSAGLTEELNNSLARLPNLIVRARTSSAYLHGKNLSIQKIADSLNVEYLLQGSVRKMGDQLRISTQLVQAATGANIWSNTYDRTMSDIFNVQQDISGSIAEALDILLDNKKRTRMHSFGTRNVEAYEEYLKGDVYYKLAHVYSTTDSSLIKANRHFEKAIALDPKFAQPYARHQDFYTHYFVDGKQGVFEYVLDDLTDSEISKIISNDLDQAIKNSSEPVFRIGYQLDKIFLSDNWQGAVLLIEEFKQMDKETRVLVINDFSWFTHLFSYNSPGILNTLYLERIENDPYDHSASNLYLSSLIRMNMLDSAAEYFDRNAIYIQSIPRLANKRASVVLTKGNFQKANNVMETAFLNQEKEAEDFSPYYILSKLLVGDKPVIKDLQGYLDKIDLRALPFYNITGQYEKADSLAHAFDAKFLGPCIISRFLFGSPLLFHLSATPNFAARLEELGVDVVKYEKEHYIKLPLTKIEGI
jgi:TolB-like protein